MRRHLPLAVFALVFVVALCVAPKVRADFRVFNSGVDGGVASGIDCRFSTCARTGSLLTITGGGGGQWTQVDGGLHYGGGAVSWDGGLAIAGNAAVRGDVTLYGMLSVDGGISANGSLYLHDTSNGSQAELRASPTNPNDSLEIYKAGTTDGMLTLRSGSASSYATVRMHDSSDVGKATFGYGNASTIAPYASKAYFYTASGVEFRWINNAVHQASWTSDGSLEWDQADDTFFVDAVNNKVGVGTVSPALTFEARKSAAATSIARIRNDSSSGFSALQFADSGGTQRLSCGYGNSGVASPYASSNYCYLGSADFKIINGSSVTTATFPNAGGLDVVGTLTSNGLTSGNAYHNGSLGVDAGITAIGNVNVVGNISGNGLTSGNAYHNGSLGVDAGVTVAGALNVVGNTLTNGLTAGNTYLNGSLGVDAGVTIVGALNNQGNATVSGSLTAGSPAYVNGTLAVDAGVSMASTLNVQGATAISGNVTCGDTSGDTLTINGTAVSVPNGVVITSAGSGIGVDVAAGASGTIGFRGTGNGSSAGVRGVGGASGPGGTFAGGATSGQGITATGSAGSASAGVLATGGASNGDGVGSTGGGTAGVGVRGTGGSTSGTGVHGQGGGTGAGVRGIGGATGIGGSFSGGSTSGIGALGTGSNVSAGVRGVGGSSGGRGGEFVGGGNGDGLSVSVDTASTGKAINMDSTNGTGYAFYAIADQSSPVSAVGRFASQDTDPSVAVFGDFYTYSGNESFRGYMRSAWREFQVLGKDATDSTGTPGSVTINKPNGRFAVAAGASVATVTNSYIAAASIVMVTPMDLDTTCTRWKAVPAAGSFTLTTEANCTAATKFMFSVE